MPQTRHKINVLYVDDELQNLVSFLANFRTIYNVFTAASAEEGKKILGDNEINVLITDQRMPHVDGVQFLESILKAHPLPVRIVLSGYADITSVIGAVNKGHIYRYVTKPFDVEELKLIIDSAYDLHTLQKESKVVLSKYKHFFETSNHSVFTLDENGICTEINLQGLELFKLEKGHIRSLSLPAMFVHPEDYDEMQNRLLNDEPVTDLPVKLRDAEHHVIHALLSVSSIYEGEKRKGVQLIVRDVTRQKEMENMLIRTIIETQEKERIRFGYNLHDGIGSMLIAIKSNLEFMALSNKELSGNPQLAKVFEYLNSTIVEIRNVCFNIMPISLEIFGLSASVNELCKMHKGSAAFAFRISDVFPKLDSHLELTVFRIIQEFINNSVMHGKAQKIEITLESKSGQILLHLKDDGVGFDIHSVEVGLGIKNIKSRIQSYSGEISMNSMPGSGTEFSIVLPELKPVYHSAMN